MRATLCAVATSCLILLGTTPSWAQQIYLDTDGDGLSTRADVLSPDHPTTVSVYLDTAHDQDGTFRGCNAHTGAAGSGTLGFFSYDLILAVEPKTGTVRWGDYQDAVGFAANTKDRKSPSEFLASRRGTSTLPQGRYLLGRIDVTPVSGMPVLRVAANSKLDAAAFTGFGTPCAGSEYMNSYVLGTDWPADNLGIQSEAIGSTGLTVAPPPGRPSDHAAQFTIRLPAARRVRLAVYDVRGGLVRTVIENSNMPAGYHQIAWDGRATNGARAASGIYFVRLEAGGERISKRLALVK